MSLGVGLALPLLATSVTLRFEHLGIEDGLSQNNAVGIVQDDQGFIWIGTQDGLNRFDGYQFKVFRRDPRRPESITHNYINQVLHSRDGTLWVGSRGGLHRFDPEADSFNNYGAREGLSDVNVTLLYEDRSGRLWVATERGGLGRFDPDEARFEPVGLDAAGQSSVQVLSLLDTYGHGLLIGTTRGLIGIDSDTGREIEVAGSMRLEGRQITALAQSGDDVLWIGTDQGLLSLDPDRSINSAQIESPGNGPRHDAIRTIFEDRHLNLWVGTRHGLIRRDQGTGEWQRHTPNQTSLGLSGNDIRVVFEDMSGVIWLGYDGSGIDRFNPTGIGFEHIGVGPDHPFGIGFPHVWAILPDSN